MMDEEDKTRNLAIFQRQWAAFVKSVVEELK